MADSAFDDSAFAGFASDVVLLFADSWAFDDSALDSSSPALSDLALFAFSALGLSASSPESLPSSDFSLLDSLVDLSSLDVSSDLSLLDFSSEPPDFSPSEPPDFSPSEPPDFSPDDLSDPPPSDESLSFPATAATRSPTAPAGDVLARAVDASSAAARRKPQRKAASTRVRRIADRSRGRHVTSMAVTPSQRTSHSFVCRVAAEAAGQPLSEAEADRLRRRPQARGPNGLGHCQGVSFQDGGTTTNRTLWPGRTCAARSTSASQTVATTG